MSTFGIAHAQREELQRFVYQVYYWYAGVYGITPIIKMASRVDALKREGETHDLRSSSFIKGKKSEEQK